MRINKDRIRKRTRKGGHASSIRRGRVWDWQTTTTLVLGYATRRERQGLLLFLVP
jgi:hypothetical protein